MAFKKSSYDRSYCYLGICIPPDSLTKDSLASLEEAIKALGHKEVSLAGLSRGKAVWDDDSGLLQSALIVGNKLKSVAREQTKHFSFNSMTKKLASLQAEDGPIAALQATLSEELQALLQPQDAHLYIVGSFTRLIWGERCLNGPVEHAEGKPHVASVRANLSNHFWDDPSVVMGIQLAETDSSKDGWVRVMDLDEAKTKMEEAGLSKHWRKNVHLMDITWWAH